MSSIDESFFACTTMNIANSNLFALGIPWDYSSSYRKGSSRGPDQIRKSTSSVLYNPYTETNVNINEKWKIFDAGNVSISSQDAIRVQKDVLEKLNHLNIDKNGPKRFLFLGGDHLITYFAFKSLFELKMFDKKIIGILYLDAHPDLYPKYNENIYSHACVLRRLIDETNLHYRNICQVGIRATTPHQREFSKKNNITVITRKEFQKQGPYKSAEIILNTFIDNIDILYLSIDLDILDPAYAPGLGNPEPGGLTTSEIVDFIQELYNLPIIMFDVVELCPKYDRSMLTAFAAAKIIKETLGIMKE